MKVLVTGATGLIGRELGKVLVRAGHEVFVLSRSKNKVRQQLSYPCQMIEADLNQGPIQDPLMSQVEAVIHLAGENVGEGRWTSVRKKMIYDSRVGLIKNLFDSLKGNNSLQVFISASAIGIYGNRGNEELTENSSRGSGFLADVCGDWEDSVLSQKSAFPKTRFAVLRTGVVLSPSGGALEKMTEPFRWGVGGALGNGKQWVSWIHLKDLVKVYLKVLEAPTAEGVFNVVSENPVTNRELTHAIAAALGKWVAPPVPSFVLKTLLGEMSSLVLDSLRVKPSALLKIGYSYEFPTVDAALEDCLKPLELVF